MALKRWIGGAAVAGGILWGVAGSVLALRPARVPGVTFRSSTDLLPWLGIGLLLIAVAVAGWHARHASRYGRGSRWVVRVLLTGATLYALGHAVRPFLRGAWEPAVPLGLLSAVVALGAFGTASWRARAVPRRVAALVLGSTVGLLLFNDQYVTAWVALPFGLVWIVIGVWLLATGRPGATLAASGAPGGPGAGGAPGRR